MLLVEEVKYAELYELREILEPAVAELAARRATPHDLEMMRSALGGMKSSTSRPEAFIRHEMESTMRSREPRRTGPSKA